MTKVEVRFSDVGRSKASWNARATLRSDPDTRSGSDELEGFCLHQIRTKLMSRYPEVVINADGTGAVYAGMHHVGDIAWSVEYEHADEG